MLCAFSLLLTAAASDVQPNVVPTMRGSSWCELNPKEPSGGMAIIFPIVNDNLPLSSVTGQSTSGAPVLDYCPAASFDAITLGRPGESPASRHIEGHMGLSPVDMQNGAGYNGPRKSLWDTVERCQLLPAMGMSMPDLICNTEGCNPMVDTSCKCLHFLWGGNASAQEPMAYDPLTVPVFPKRQFMQGKLQPVLTHANGDTWVLQSFHVRTNAGAGSDMLLSGGSYLGEDANMCDYINSCCSTAAAHNYTVSCGLLSETVVCGPTAEMPAHQATKSW